MVAVLITAALAAMAIPNYTKTLEVGRSSEAKADLQQIYAGQAWYKLNNGVYWDPTDPPDVSDIDATIRTTLSTQYYTISDIDATSGTSFTASAKRANSSSKQFDIVQTGSITESGSY